MTSMAPASPGPKRHQPLSAAWAWIRATVGDPNRAAWLYIPVLGFLPLTFGSLGTLFYFAGSAYIGLIFLAGRLRWVWPPTTAFGCLVALGYFAATLVSPLFFPDKIEGWQDVGTAFHYLVLTMMVGMLVQTPKVDVFDLFLNGVRAAAIVSFGHALVQVVVFGHPRATAGMANPIPFGDTAVLAAGLSMVGFVRLSTRMRLFALAGFAGGIGGCLLSQTRGALLALPLLAVVTVIHLWPIIRARLWQAALLAAVMASGLGLFAHAVKIPERIEQVFQALDAGVRARHGDPSTAHRVVMWSYGLDAFLDRPVLGYGSQNAVDEVRERAERDGFDIPPYRHLHNEFMSTAVGRGIVGLVALLMLLIAPVLIALQGPRDGRHGDRLAFAALLSGGYGIFGLTNLLFSHDQTNTVFASAYLVLVAASHQAQTGPTAFTRPFLGVPPAR